MPSNSNRTTSDTLKLEQNAYNKLNKQKENLSKKTIDALYEYEKEKSREVIENEYYLKKQLEEETAKLKIDNAKKEGNVVKEAYIEAFGTLERANQTVKNTVGSLTKAIDASLNSYISAQQSMAAHLQGSNTSLTNITNTLQRTLSVSGIVKQQDVYTNLSKLVDRGIVYNVEQRAFLETMARDIHATFDATDGTLARLIRIQTQDLSSNRLAIEYSLQTFLNTNYQTSEYIRESFQSVSKSLLSAQVALQNSTKAMELEAAVQTQLGAMYSSGLSNQTVEGLAKAINALGSGDVTSLGSGMSNLLVMAAARAGLDYGELLNKGVTGQQATTLLQNVTSYLAEMGANQSNVVKAQLGQLFGVDITDIIAAQNIGTVSGSVGSDISRLFGDYGNFITFGTSMSNRLANLKYSFGTNIASNPTQLMAYEATKMIAESGLGDILMGLGDIVSGSGSKIPLIGGLIGTATEGIGKAMQIAGLAANAAPLIPIITSLFGKNGTAMDILNSIGASSQGVAGLYAALAGGQSSDLTIKSTNAGVSGGVYIGSGSTTDLISSNMSSLNELTSNVVTISSEEDKITWEDNVATMTTDLAAIYELLNTYMQGISDNLDIISNASAYSAGGATGLMYSVASHIL